ncbi:hypothetical protein Tco_0949814 [Tanacetum coccineum]
MVSNKIRPPGFPPIQNNQNRFNQNQGNFNQNRGTNFNQNRGNNFYQGQVYQPSTNQTSVHQALAPQMQGVSKTDFENYVKANGAVLSPQRTCKTCEGHSTPLVPTSIVSTPPKEPEQNPETSMDKVQEPSGSTTNHSDALPPSSSPMKTSDNLEEFADELTLLKKVVHEENFQVYSSPLFEFDDNFTSSNVNPLFNEIDEDVKNKNSYVSNSDEPVLLNTPLSDKVESSDPEDDIDEIDAFLTMEVSSNFEEGYFDSEGDVIFLENLLSDDTTHNLAPEVISDHEPKQNESIHNTSVTFSPRSDPLHHEFAGELLTLPSRIENVHANPSSIIESLPTSLIPVEDNDPVQEEIDIFLVPDDLIPPGVENDDSEDEDNELPNLDHQDNPSSPRPPPEPPDVCLNFKPATAMRNEDFNQGEIVLSLNVEDVNSFTFVIWNFLPFFTYPEDSPVILSLRSEDLVFYPGISTFHFSLKPVPFALPKDK